MTKPKTPEEKAALFLESSSLYRLGNLPTELSHPDTRELSQWAKEDPSRALRALEEIDEKIFNLVLSKEKEGVELARAIRETLTRGKRVFFSGCGATGRLALTLEALWRESFRLSPLEDSVIGFMAGGDVAVVRSVEHFEDHPEYGARQLQELGFQDGDLLIAVTEGGETPYVIGTVEEAVKLSPSVSPWFVYCNPTDLLVSEVERSRNVLTNPLIRKFELFTGPMALSGSTRLQATTAQLLATGVALLSGISNEAEWREAIEGIRSLAKQVSGDWLIPFIEKETAAYQEGGAVLYSTNRYGVTVLTDTTERSPTFSLTAFENRLDPIDGPLSLSFLFIEGASDSKEAWEKVLGRLPRGLNWTLPDGTGPDRIGLERILGFDFSAAGRAARAGRLKRKIREEAMFRLTREPRSMRLELGREEWEMPLPFLHPSDPDPEQHLLGEHLVLKLLLNRLSLLVMARMGRLEGNIMTWVRPSNGKLVDRSIRYVRHLYADRKGKESLPSYDETAVELFRALEGLTEEEPIVLRTLKRMGINI